MWQVWKFMVNTYSVITSKPTSTDLLSLTQRDRADPNPRIQSIVWYIAYQYFKNKLIDTESLPEQVLKCDYCVVGIQLKGKFTARCQSPKYI